MTNVTPQVFMIARTEADQNGFQEWLTSIGAGAYMHQANSQRHSERLIEAAGRRCYMSFEPGLNPNVTKVRTDSKAYFENILSSGHGSVLRHTTVSFAIEFVSRVFTAELNRHSAGVAISEGSMRYIRLTDMKAWNPWQDLLDRADHDDDEKYARKYHAASVEFQAAFEEAEARQHRMESLFADELASGNFGIKKALTSRFRRTAPMGIATGGIWTFNLQALRHILVLRSTPAVEEEMVPVMKAMGDIALERWPNVFQDFTWTTRPAPQSPGWECKYPKV